MPSPKSLYEETLIFARENTLDNVIQFHLKTWSASEAGKIL
jgi:hypothetical protein